MYICGQGKIKEKEGGKTGRKTEGGEGEKAREDLL